MQTPNKFLDPERVMVNRQAFTNEQAARAVQQRNGMFTMALPLTVGDSSTNYQTYRKERHEVGTVRGMTVNPCKNSNENFTKFTSNALGDPYVDPGKFNGNLRSASTKSKPFLSMHGNRTVQKSEFNNMKETGPHVPPNHIPGMYNRKTAEPFTQFKHIAYSEDPFERKEDLGRDEYARLNSKILHRNQPFSQVVQQHGSFYGDVLTFANRGEFPEKRREEIKPPNYGAFKHGDKAHVGHNKTLGGPHACKPSQEYAYEEEREQDMVKFQKNVGKPIWRTSHQMGKSMMNATVQNNARNIAVESQHVFSK